MSPASPSLQDEARRLRALRALALLDTPPEPLFDSLVRLAASVCGTPIALVSLVDADRQWFKANLGLTGVSQTPREVSFCTHAVQQPQLFEVDDARQDARFADNPLVTGEPGIGFYAGVPLAAPDGHRVGTLCVIDRQARRLSAQQRAQLLELGRAANAALQVRAEGLLQAAQFQLLAQNLPVGAFQCAVDGRCSYVNPRWSEICGLPAHAGLGLGWLVALFPGDPSGALAAWQAAVQARAPFEARNSVVHADGSQRRVHVRAAPQLDAGGTLLGYVGVIEDETEALRLEGERREMQALLDHAAHLAGLGAWSVRLVEPMQIRWSAQTARIHDREPGHVPSFDEAVAYYNPEGRPALMAAFSRTAEGAEPFDVELPFTTAKGRARWVRAFGEPLCEAGQVIGMVGAFQDVTERREREAALALTHAQLRQLYERTPALLVSLDAQCGVLALSDALLDRLGLTRAQAHGQAFSQWLTPGSRLALEQALPRLFEHGRLERLPCRFAAPVAMEGLLSAIRVLGDGPPRALAVLEDVTETLLRTRELREVEEQRARLSELLEERSEMLSVLAHEVRQPLNNASAALQHAAQAVQLPGAAAALARADRVLGQVMAGVDNTLAAASLLAGQQAPVRADTDLDLLLGIAIADLPADARERIRLARHSAVRTLHLDLGLSRLALRNLLANAVAFAPPGTEVQLRISDTPNSLGVCIDVEDQGPGVDPMLQPRLFERGVRGPVHERRGSHGLGLYIARQAMLLQGGQALLLRSDARGSVFRLRFEE